MNDPKAQRDFFAGLLHSCPLCGNERLASILNIAEQADHPCPGCSRTLTDFVSFWQEITHNTEEIKIIAKHKNAQLRLRKILFSYGKRGVHRPLILPSTLKIEVTNRCNLRCKHCLADSGMTKTRELPIQELERLLTEAKALGVNTVGVVGGEPLLRKDLSQILDIITRLRLVYSISTNAMLINDGIVAAINRKNLLKVSVSIDGIETWHNSLRGHSNAYQLALNGIQKLTKAKIKVAVAMVITKDNFEMIDHVLDVSSRAGATYFAINDLIPTGRGCDMRDACLSYAEYLELANRIKSLAETYKDKITILWKGMRPDRTPDSELGQFVKSICGAALTELTVDHEGYILPCPFLPRTNENVLQKSLEEIWYHSDELKAYQNRDDLTGGCGNCNRKLSCSGCRARAKGHFNDIYGPDPRCPRCQ